jgi:SPX domain protein involved in polyphosphate accumulation
MATNVEREIYKKQSIQMSEDAKKSISIPSSIILTTEDDCVLGRIIRDLMTKKIEECDKHIDYMSNLK